MTDPFARHGINHLSASSMRLYKECPAVWVARYLMNVPDDAGPKAWRGIAVEAGLDRVLFENATHEDALKHAQLAWDSRAMGVIDAPAAREYEKIGDYLAQAMLAFAGKGMPLTRQGSIKINLPGIEVPVIGYTDYRYQTQGYDLKTTDRIPSQATPGHIEQLSGYMLSTGLPFTLVYASTKRWVSYDVTPPMAAAGYERLLEAAHAIRAFLAKVEDGRDALTMVAPDYDSFYFTDLIREAVRAAKRPVEVRP